MTTLFCLMARFIAKTEELMITYEKLFGVQEEKGLNKAWLRKNGIHP